MLFVCLYISHLDYLKDGLKHMRLKFYIEGSEPGLKGTVHSESKEVGIFIKYMTEVLFCCVILLLSTKMRLFDPWKYLTVVFIQDPETGKYVFRYIFVDVDTYPRRTIVVEDNR